MVHWFSTRKTNYLGGHPTTYFVASVSVFWTQINICAKKAAVYEVLMSETQTMQLFCFVIVFSSLLFGLWGF